MKYHWLQVSCLLLLLGCQTSPSLPPISQINPNFTEQGTLANHALITRASAEIEQLTGISGHDLELLYFIAQKPVGDVGWRAWREIWLLNTPSHATPFLLTFNETGLGTTNFTIKQLENIARNNRKSNDNDNDNNTSNCPDSFGGFKVKESSAFVKSCLGTPHNIDQIPGQGYVYYYPGGSGVVLTYIFDASDQLIDFNEYKTGK